MGDHPVLKTIALIGAIIGVISSSVGVWFYLEDLRNENAGWYEDDKNWNASILDNLNKVIENQAKINTILATQSVQLSELETLINQQTTLQNSRFEQLEDEHKIIIQAIYNMNVDISHSLGLHEGKHHSDNKRVSSNGKAAAFQAVDVGSNPSTRSFLFITKEELWKR